MKIRFEVHNIKTEQRQIILNCLSKKIYYHTNKKIITTGVK